MYLCCLNTFDCQNFITTLLKFCTSFSSGANQFVSNFVSSMKTIFLTILSEFNILHTSHFENILFLLR